MPRTKHGMYKTTEYRRWVGMKARCAKDARYIAKGIKVCKRWEKFENFYADMGNMPSPKHTLDRINGAKGYSPSNCRWATYTEQNRNLSSNVRVGRRTLAEIAKAAGVSHNTVRYRLAQGLQVDAAPIGARTHCKAGHPWNEDNTYLATVKRKQGGTREQRYCRVCRAQHQADLRERRKGINNKGGLHR